ncbi:hypothetical protein AX774_g1182, partial [Zancudomyces culisetae]
MDNDKPTETMAPVGRKAEETVTTTATLANNAGQGVTQTQTQIQPQVPVPPLSSGMNNTAAP